MVEVRHSKIYNIVEKYIKDGNKKINKGVNLEEINKFEKEIGLQVPDSFKDIYLTYNGEGDSIFGLLAGFRLLSLDEIRYEIDEITSREYNFISDRAGVIKEGSFKKEWIPFANDCSGAYLVMDLTPDSKGTYGQIISIDSDLELSYYIADSINEFIRFIENCFEIGKVTIENEHESTFVLWKNGHIFDYIISMEEGIFIDSKIKLDKFWSDFFCYDVEDGYIKKETLINEKKILIRESDKITDEKIDLSILKHMPELRTLIVKAKNIESYEPLVNCTKLKTLEVSKIKDEEFNYLKELKDLRELTISNSKINVSLEKGALENLDRLGFVKSKVTFVKFESLENISKLSLDSLFEFEIDFIGMFKGLKNLEVKNMKIKNIDFFKNLDKLVCINIDIEPENENGLEYLNKMRNIKEFIYPLKNLSIVKNFSQLTDLGINVDYGNIEDIKNLSIENITIFGAKSKEEVLTTVSEFKNYFNIKSYGYIFNQN